MRVRFWTCFVTEADLYWLLSSGILTHVMFVSQTGKPDLATDLTASLCGRSHELVNKVQLEVFFLLDAEHYLFHSSLTQGICILLLSGVCVPLKNITARYHILSSSCPKVIRKEICNCHFPKNITVQNKQISHKKITNLKSVLFYRKRCINSSHACILLKRK